MVIIIAMFLGLNATSKAKSPNGEGSCEISLYGVPINKINFDPLSNPNVLEKCIYYNPIGYLVLIEHYKYQIMIFVFLIGISALFMTLKK
jgi:hypothetical protein